MYTVNHKQFGTGTITSRDTKTVTVDFSGTTKTLLIKYANLTLEDGSVLTEAKKVKASTKLTKIYYSKYSDTELMQMHNELLGDLVEAKAEARKDGKTGSR